MTAMNLCMAWLIMLYGVIFWLTHGDEEETLEDTLWVEVLPEEMKGE
mgnify:CR=1 FL=1